MVARPDEFAAEVTASRKTATGKGAVPYSKRYRRDGTVAREDRQDCYLRTAPLLDGHGLQGNGRCWVKGGHPGQMAIDILQD